MMVHLKSVCTEMNYEQNPTRIIITRLRNCIRTEQCLFLLSTYLESYYYRFSSYSTVQYTRKRVFSTYNIL